MHAAVRHSLLVRRSTKVAWFVVVSIAAHAAAVALVIVLGMMNRPPPIQLDQKPIRASLVRLGTPRKPTDLPRFTEAPPPPKEVIAPAPPRPDPAPKAPSPAATAPAPDAKQAGKKDGEDSRKRLFGAFDRVGAKAEDVEGAADGDPYGDSAIAEGEAYYAAMRSAIRRYYDVSQTIPDRERIRLRAEVVVRVSRSGEVLQTRLAKPSGNDLFDSAVLSAVKKASPFAPPPPHLRDELDRRGIILEFTP